MAFSICNGSGDSVDAPSVATMKRFLDDLDCNDEEHGAVWLSDDENSLEYEAGGNLCFSTASRERHLSNVSTARVLELWTMLVTGRMDELERQPWCDGSRPEASAEEREARVASRMDHELALDREFYRILGDERPSSRCRSDDCLRGTVQFSVFCRRHHFENVKGRSCPFD